MKCKKDLLIPFTWEERRPACLERFFYLPKYLDHQQMWLDFSELFGNDHPVHLELCSGNGQWIGKQAFLHPEINWIAVEMRFDRARKIWLKLFREKIHNLYVVCAEAATFLHYYVKPDSIRETFVNFPDPWPKRYHGKHRLIWAPFLKLLQAATQKGGCATLLTDDARYRDQMIREFAKTNGWQSALPPPFYITEWSDYGASFFSDLWQMEGRTFFYMKYANH